MAFIKMFLGFVLQTFFTRREFTVTLLEIVSSLSNRFDEFKWKPVNHSCLFALVINTTFR